MNPRVIIFAVLFLVTPAVFAVDPFSLSNYQQAPPPASPQELQRTNTVGENAITGAGRQQKIALVPGGASADYGLQKAFFPADVNGESPLIITSPDGSQLTFRPRLLAWHDVSTGERWLLAQVTNQVGLVIGSNRVLYTNAFDGLRADLRYRYSRHGLEQDVILRVAPLIPTNISPENLKLEVWTEWFNATPSAQLVQSIDLREGSDTTNAAVTGDESLTFGTMRIGAGHAFSINNSADRTPVAKQWAQVEGRNWLIETVDYLAIKTKCDELALSSNRTARLVVGKEGLIAALDSRSKMRKSGSEALLASVDIPETPGVVLDFAILSCVPVPAGAVSWWPAGGNADDALDGNNGTMVDLATYAPGEVGQGFSLPAYDYDLSIGGGYLRVPDNANLHFTNGLTIEAWVNPGENFASDYFQMVDKWEVIFGGGTKSYSTGIDPNGHFFLLLSPGGYDTGAAFVLSSNTIPVGEWTHVAATYDRSALKVYVNGVIQAQGSYTNSVHPGTNDMGIGGIIGGGVPGQVLSRFYGRIDEPTIYNRALSASEIQTIYEAGVAGKINPNCLEAPANLVAWWPGDQHVFDIAGTNNVTLQNGATYAPGVVSQGFSFDGTNDSLLTTNASVLNFNTNDNFSIELWLQPQDIATSNGVMTLLSKRLVSNTNTVVGWELFLLDGAPALQLADAPLRTTNWVNYVLTGTDLADGGWHHLVVTVDRSTNNGGSFYLEGVKVATFNPTLMPGALTNNEPLLIGVHPQGALHCNYAGMMDEISIYRRALTGTEVSQLYQAGGAGKCRADVDHDGLEDWWEMRFFENLDQGPNDNPDSDVFNNLEESQNHTDPTVFDKRALIVTWAESGYEPSEQAIKDRLEGLGYLVTQKRDSIVVASDTKYQTVVVVSPDVFPGNLNTKLNNVVTPILCMGNYMLRDLKLTGTTSGTDYDGQSGQTATTIIDSGHPLAAGFSGSVTVTTSGAEYVWGNPNTNAIRVARLSGGTTNQLTVFGFEKGKLMNQLVAPARRVGFFGRDTTVLNSNGWQLFDAAINWLATPNVTGAPNTPAQITITNPTNSAVFNAGDNITLTADVIDADTGVQKVVFYHDNTRLGSVTSPVTNNTYTMVWSNAPAGTYEIKVRAIDFGDTGTLSAQPVFITVRSSALFVTGSTNLNSSEDAISNRLSQLGFSVTTRAAADIIAEDTIGKTLVFLSATVSVADGTNKFGGLNVPVISWADQLYPDLGFVDGSNHGTASGESQVCVLMPSHPLSGGLSGTNAVLLSPDALNWGTPGVNAVKVAIVNGETNKAVIFGYDRGVSMFGRVALARKVGFFLSESNAVLLTTSGWNLFDAAIAWAIDKPCPTAIDLVLAMDRSGGMNGQPMDDAKTAAKLLVNSLELGTDQVGLVSFHNIPSLDQALTNNATAVTTAIDALLALGPDRIDFGITNAQAELTGVRRNPSALPVMILMTHGTNAPLETSTNINIAADAAKATGIRLIVVGFGNVDQERLSAIASSSADFYNAPLSSELADISASIGDAFCRNTNLPPSVTITNPVNGQGFAGPTADVTIQATASDLDGTITSVEFFHGEMLLTNFTSAPYSFIWSNRTVGAYTIFVRATDNNGATALSSVSFNVLKRPAIWIVNPPNNDVRNAPAQISLMSVVNYGSGVVTNVSYYVNDAFLASSIASPYPFVWTNVLGGTYVFQAIAQDSYGLSATSTFVTNIVAKVPPRVTITVPLSNAVFAVGEPLTIQAAASDADGYVTNVQFLAEAFVLGNDTNAPYVFTWTNGLTMPTNLLAIASDNDGLTRTSTVPVLTQSCASSGVSDLLLSVDEIIGGNVLSGTVVLNNAAISGGQAIEIGSSHGAAVVPKYVFIPEGQYSNTFAITTVTADVTNVANLSAFYHGQTPAVTAALTVYPASAAGLVPGLGGLSSGLVTTNLEELGGPDRLVREIVGNGVQVYNVTYTGSTQAAGIFRGGKGIFEIDDGIILSTGNITNVIGPNTRPNATGAWFGPSDPDLDDLIFDPGHPEYVNKDAVVLEFDFVPQTELVAWDYVFGSEEYNEYSKEDCADGLFNDVFGFFVTNAFYGKTNVALLLDGTPVNVRNVNNLTNADFYHDNSLYGILYETICDAAGGDPDAPFNTELDGFTRRLTAYARVVPGVTNHIKLAIEDARDEGWDSVVMIRAGSFRSIGSTVYVRDDQNRQYSPFTVSGSQTGAAASAFPVVDTHGMQGQVNGFRMRREGMVEGKTGSRFDAELGVAGLTNSTYSFGLLFTNAQGVAQSRYAAEWLLPETFQADAQTNLGGAYFIRLTNRVSSLCGQTVNFIDTPQEDWPWSKNIALLSVVQDRLLSQNRALDFVLIDGNQPLNGDWDIVFRDAIVASSGRPNGWDLETDHTAFDGYIVTAPSSAAPDRGYELRVRNPGSSFGRSTVFTVMPSNSVLSASVLLPLVLSTNLVESPQTVALTVSLDGPAPLGDAFIPIYTNGVPWNIVVIPSGGRTATTNLLVPGTGAGEFEIFASYNGYRIAKVQKVVGCSTPAAPQIDTIGTNQLGVLLTWDAVVGASSYTVTRSNSTSGSWTVLFKGLATNTFIDTEIVAPATNYYRVTAVKDWCESVSAETNINILYAHKCPGPSIIPFGGIFNDSVSFLLTNYLAGTTTRYTTNGDQPTLSSDWTTGGYFTLTNDSIVKAFSAHSSYAQQSRTVSATFTIITPKPIECNTTESGELSPASSFSTVDGVGFYCARYVFDAVSDDVGKFMTITANSANFDTYLYLKDGSTNVLAQNDDYSETNSNARIVYQVKKTGPHVVEVTSYYPWDAGSFSLQFNCGTPPRMNAFTNAYISFTNAGLIAYGGLLEFGTNTTGTTVTKYITITNSGLSDLVISQIAAHPKAETNNTMGFSVSPGSTTTLARGDIAHFAISLVSTQQADFLGHLIFEHNDPEQPSPFFIDLTGQVRNAVTNANTPVMAILDTGTNVPAYTMLDLGRTTNGTAISRDIVITNAGESTLNVVGHYFTLPNVFSLTPSPVTNLAPHAAAAFTIQFVTANSDRYTGSLVFTNNDPGTNPFVLHLTAVSNPDGAPPIVSITAPANDSSYSAPATVMVSASATPSGGTTITNVEFAYRTADGAFFIGRDTSSPYSATWNVGTPGHYALVAAAWDSLGRIGISEPISVTITSANHPPVATTDNPSVLANSINNVFDLLANDTDGDDDPLTIMHVTPPAYGKAEILDYGKKVRYTPPYFQYGSDGFSYDVSDGHGGVTRGRVWITIEGGDVPQIAIVTPTNGETLQVAEPYEVTVSITPPGVIPNVVKVEYYIGDDKIGEVTEAPFTTFNWPVRGEHCDCGIKARVYDKFGQFSESKPVPYNFSVPDGKYPVAKISSPALVTQLGQVAPHMPIVQEGLLVVTGSVYLVDNSATNAAEYKILIKKPEGEIIQDTGWLSPIERHNAAIYTNDLTMLQNDIYDLELLVRDNYSTKSAEVRFALDSNLKIGPFMFSEQDVMIPVNGIPLTVVRSYNSMNLEAGDFGCSWTYAINDVNLTLHEERAVEHPLFEFEGKKGPGPGGSFTRRVSGNRDVTLTLPDGRRTTFYYYEVAGQCNPGDQVSACIYPRYQAAPGINAELRPVNQHGFDLQGYDGLTGSWRDQGSTFNIRGLDGGAVDAHEMFDFPGFILKTADGTEFYIPREHQGNFEFLTEEGESGQTTTAANNYVEAYGKARLAEIRQRSGDKIVINTDTIENGQRQFSVDHFNPTGQKTRSLYFKRDEKGRITAVMDPIAGSSGVAVVKYEYDSANNLSRVLRLQDRVAQTYTTNTYLYEHSKFPHYLTKILDPRGVPMARNIYDEETGRLKGVIDANGKTNLFLHDITGRTETTFDRMGNRTVYGYDEQGNVTLEVNALNQRVERTYDNNNNLISVTDSLGNTIFCDYDSDGNRIAMTNALREVTRFAFEDGRLRWKMDALGNTTRFNYDVTGHRNEIIDALGNSVTIGRDSYGRPTALTNALNLLQGTAASDNKGDLLFVSQPGGIKMDFAHDLNGNTTNTAFVWVNPEDPNQRQTNSTFMELDASGRVVHVSDPDGRQRFTVYDPVGRVLESVNRLSNTNAYLYDVMGNLIQTTYPDGSIVRNAYDDNGRLIFVTDRNLPGVVGNGVHTVYDAIGRITRVERIASMDISIEYESAIPRSLLFSTGAVLSASSSAYDDAGRMRFTTNALGRVTEYEYDDTGRQIGVVDALNHRAISVYDKAGHLIISANDLGQITRYGYDAKGRRVSTIFPDNSYTTNYYNQAGQLVWERDQMNRTTDYEYDDLGRMTAVILPEVFDPVGATNARPRYEYEYDQAGNLLVLRDAKGRVTKSTYDGFGQLVTRVLPMLQTYRNVYNALGQLDYAVDPKGQTNRFYYDSFGRAVTNLFYAAGAITPGQTNRLEYGAGGEFVRMIRAEGETLMSYNLNGSLTNITSPEGSISYEYDTAMGYLTRAYTTNTDVRYGYNELGQLKTVTLVKRKGIMLSPPEVTTSAYTAQGSLESVHYPNGTRTEYQYNVMNCLTNMVHYDGDNEVLARYEYVVASDGTRLASTETRRESGGDYSTTQINWSNDNLRRLVREASVSTITALNFTNAYVYDLVGNRLWKTNMSGLGTQVTQYTYNANDQLETDGMFVNLYDANGSLTNRFSDSETNCYTYNLEGRLAGALVQRQEGGLPVAQTNQYYYNAAGIRTRVETTGTGSETNIFLNDPQNLTGFSQVLEQLPQVGGVPAVTYTIGNSVLAQEQGGVVSYVMADGHGSTRLLTDSDGVISDRYSYDAFGQGLDFTSGVWNSTTTKLLYTGELYDPGLQQFYLRARYYNPTIGRFGVSDQMSGILRDPLTLHRYSYCQNNPVNGRDPSGNFLLLDLQIATAIGTTLETMYNLTIAKVGDMLKTGSKEAIEAVQHMENDDAKSDVATTIIHGVDGFKLGGGVAHSYGWSQSFREALSTNDPLSYASSPLTHDFYEFNWGGFSLDIEYKGEAIASVGILPVKSVHQMASIHLRIAELTLYMKGYERMNIISHSWGTTLAYDQLMYGGVEINNWVTMGSPLNHEISKPIWLTGTWINAFSKRDPITYLNMYPASLIDSMWCPLFIPRLATRPFNPADVDIWHDTTNTGNGFIEEHGAYWTHTPLLDVIRANLQ